MCKTTSFSNTPAAPASEEVSSTWTTTESRKQPGTQWSKLNAALKSHPVTFDDFYRLNPSFVWGPMLVAGLLYGVATHVESVTQFLQARNMEFWGFSNALHYTLFAILGSYAFHGFCTTHAPRSLKVQADNDYQVQPDAMAIRSTAALITELVYAFMPLAPSTYKWYEFAMWSAILTIYWDLHFYIAHRICHENAAAYKFFHKTHHLCKEPNCFGAYFVTYQSHIVLEQLVVLLLAIAGLPRNVFIFQLYWGTLGTYVEHSGFELGTMKLPLVPITFGQLCQIVGASTSWILDGVSVAEHDWHHEKFLANYSLSFKYLDKMLGTYHPGREPGTGKVIDPDSSKEE